MNVDEIVAKQRARHRKNVASAGPVLRDSALGRAVAELLEANLEVSVESLRALVSSQIARTPSARARTTSSSTSTLPPLDCALELLSRHVIAK